MSVSAMMRTISCMKFLASRADADVLKPNRTCGNHKQ